MFLSPQCTEKTSVNTLIQSWSWTKKIEVLRLTHFLWFQLKNLYLRFRHCKYLLIIYFFINYFNKEKQTYQNDSLSSSWLLSILLKYLQKILREYFDYFSFRNTQRNHRFFNVLIEVSIYDFDHLHDWKCFCRIFWVNYAEILRWNNVRNFTVFIMNKRCKWLQC